MCIMRFYNCAYFFTSRQSDKNLVRRVIFTLWLSLYLHHKVKAHSRSESIYCIWHFHCGSLNTEAFPRNLQLRYDDTFKNPSSPRELPKIKHPLKQKKEVVLYIGQKSWYKIQTVEYFCFIDLFCSQWGVNGSGWQGSLPPNARRKSPCRRDSAV